VAKNKAAPARANGMKTFYGVLALIAVVGVAAIVYTARSGGGSMATEPLNLSDVADASTLLERARGESVGSETAPVQILVFSDFMCPACAHWAGVIEPQLKQEFVSQGKVHLTYYDFPLAPSHRFSFIASRAARCSGDQDRFWEFHNQLFATQQQWSYSNSVPVDHFMRIARELGLDTRSFENCLRSDEHAELVTANRLLGEQLRVGGTPTVFLNGRQLQEWSDYSKVREAVIQAGGA
jgi:protein-disulfide isomerase